MLLVRHADFSKSWSDRAFSFRRPLSGQRITVATNGTNTPWNLAIRHKATRRLCPENRCAAGPDTFLPSTPRRGLFCKPATQNPRSGRSQPIGWRRWKPSAKTRIFLHNTAPQLEAEALAAHRKAVNAPLKKQPPRGASSRLSRIVSPLKRLPRPSRRVVVATAAASLCFSLGYVARAVFVPQSANIGLTERTDMPQTLPEIYQKLTDKSVAAPFPCPASGKSLPTPSLYQDIVNDNP